MGNLKKLMAEIDLKVDIAVWQTVLAMEESMREKLIGLTYPTGRTDDGNDYGAFVVTKMANGSYEFLWKTPDWKFIEYGYGAYGAANPYPGDLNGWTYGGRESWFYPDDNYTLTFASGKTGNYSRSMGHSGKIAPLYHTLREVDVEMPNRLRRELKGALK